MDDWDLLRDYASTSSQQAFRTLADRYVDFVYSAALRQVGNRHLAEDVTQGVFLVLSQKAAELARQKSGVLAGWLFKVTRFTSANAIKTESRRRKHEAKSPEMNTHQNNDASADWETLSPHLDAALSGLASIDRDAVLLRFFSGKSHRDIAQALGITEEAARKRVARSIEKLRQILGAKGIALGTIGLSTLLTSNAVQAAPAGLGAACGTGICGTTGATLAKGALIMITATKTKMIAASVLIVLFVAGAGGLAIQQMVHAAAPKTLPRPAAPIAAIAQGVPAQPAPAQSVISGIVKSSTGEPLGGVQVLLATQSKKVDIYTPKPSAAANALSADDGSFSFDAPPGPCMVVVRHQLGYAQITREQLEADAQIILQPWARVEGIAKIGSAPAAGATILINRFTEWQNPYAILVEHERATKADAQGHYSFDQVAPGDTWVWRRADPQGYMAALEYVEAQSGKTAKVALGGRGQPVIGRVVLPKDTDEKIDWQFRRGTSFVAGLMPAGMSLADRDIPPDLTWEQKRVRAEAWSRTPIGQLAKTTNYGVSFWLNPDGTFRMDDVAPGLHRMSIRIHHEDKGSGYYDGIGEFETRITVPDLSAQGGQTDQPQDLGTVTMTAWPRLRVGRPAPPFTLKKLDGTEVKLADFAGKFVLLVPWATTRQPTEEDIKAIKLASEKNAKAGKLVILTVEFQDDPQTAQALIKSSGLTDIGIHCTAKISSGGFAGLFAGKNVIPLDYFQAPSLITLIDPDGKVAAKNLSGENIEGAVYRASFER